MAINSEEQVFWDRVFDVSFLHKGSPVIASDDANAAVVARREAPGGAVGELQKLRSAARIALKLLGPSAPACSGCAVEMNEAVRALTDALS